MKCPYLLSKLEQPPFYLLVKCAVREAAAFISFAGRKLCQNLDSLIDCFHCIDVKFFGCHSIDDILTLGAVSSIIVYFAEVNSLSATHGLAKALAARSHRQDSLNWQPLCAISQS
jgi:hypothetical protein